MTLVSCHNDDDHAAPMLLFPLDSQMEGEWHLTNVEGGFGGRHYDFPAGEIVWDFHTQTHTVTVDNNNTDEAKVDFFDSGTYSYAIIKNPQNPGNCAYKIVIKGTNLGCYGFAGDTFTMSQAGLDGYTLRLIREPQVIPYE